MTVISDLQQQRVCPLFFLMIDGIEPIFVQPHHLGAPSWSRSCKAVLSPSTEHATKLDLGDMLSSVSAMEFELDDFEESDGTWYFGKLFACGRWDTGTIARVAAGTAHNQQIAANATAISVKSTTAFPGSGTGHIGGETLTYAGVTGSSLTGVDKGLYPCIDGTPNDRWGCTYPRPMASEKGAGALHHIAQYPFTVAGRRVGFYVTTRDDALERWNPRQGSNVIWTDAFGDASIGPLWTTYVGGTRSVTESGGDMVMASASGSFGWGPGAQNKMGADVMLSDIGADGEALLDIVASVTYESNYWHHNILALCLDDTNFFGCQIYNDGSKEENQGSPWSATAGVFDGGTPTAHVAGDPYSALLRLYWNKHSTETYTIVNGDTLAPGYWKGYLSRDGGTTWTSLVAATAAAVTPTRMCIANFHGAADFTMDSAWHYITVTQTVETDDSAKLLWAGRIGTDKSIRQDGKTGKWHLACTSILDDLKLPLCNDLPTGYLSGINLTGSAKYRAFVMHQYDNTAWIGTKTITVPSGVYSIDGLCSAVQDAANAVSWTAIGGGTPDDTVDLSVTVNESGDAVRVAYFADSATDLSVTIDAGGTGEFCHAWSALGFEGRSSFSILLPAASGWNEIEGETYYDHYHPVHRDCNGSRLYLYRNPGFWANQGDDSTTCANVVVEGASLVSDPKKEYIGNLYCRYTSVLDMPTYSPALVLDHVHNPKYSVDGYVGCAHGDDPVKVTQCLLPRWDVTGSTKRGPFEQMLFPLLSTGTDGYNEDNYAYDALPLQCSVGMQEALVDVQSFLDADADVTARCPTLAARPLWPWKPGMSWSDRLREECVLFGYALVWRRGQIAVQRVLSSDVDLVDVTINDSSHAGYDSFPDQTLGLGTVVNQHTCKLTSAVTGKEYTVVISDGDSTLAYHAVKDVEINHGGLPLDTGLVYVKGLLDAELTGRPLRFASPEVDVPVVHALMYRLWVGGVVRYVATNICDPVGSGARSVNVLATVVGVQWDYAEGAGLVSLQLHAKYSRLGTPYAPAALVNIAASNGGWSDANDRLTLVALTFGETGDPDDGAALAPTGGEELLIIERAPADPAAPLSWQVTVKAATPYETDGAEILSLAAGTTLTSWDADREYIVTYADWDLPVVAAQELLGTWQADATTELLASGGTNDSPQRYG